MEQQNPPLLAVSHLKKCFGETPVLDDVSFDLRRGETAVILGPSGCGKSTLLRCINALEPIQGGEIRLDGQTIDRSPAALPALRQRVGMVFQSYELFPHLTVMDNLLLAPEKVLRRSRDAAKAEALALLERVNLKGLENRYPRELSGGQKQRVAIVRALCMHPEILLFDEVTAALDPEMVREVLDVILDLGKQGRTMLIVTHELAFARAIAHRILFLDGGRVAEEAPPEQFFTHPATPRARQFLHQFDYGAPRA